MKFRLAAFSILLWTACSPAELPIPDQPARSVSEWPAYGGDVETGEELWKGRLPAGGQATPMSYRVEFEDGRVRQYVVIAAGGHARSESKLGDHLVAFALEGRP